MKSYLQVPKKTVMSALAWTPQLTDTLTVTTSRLYHKAGGERHR
jgi:hypothetical protein